MHEFVDPLRQAGYDIELVYAGNLTGVREGCSSLARLRRETRGAAIVHAQYGSGCAALASLLPSSRVLTLRGSDWYGVASQRRAGRGAIAPWLTRAVVRRFRHVVVVSNRMRRDVARFVGDGRISVLPSGIDLTRFFPRERMAARHALGEDGDARPWVLFSSVADQNPVKRAELAQAAMHIVNRHRPEVQLKIMTGVERALVPEFVSACNVILLTSTHEGWPNIVKEGLASNIPFVSTDVSDLAEIASREPSCAVTDADPDALARALLDVLEASPANLRQYVEPMSMSRTAAKLASIYDALA